MDGYCFTIKNIREEKYEEKLLSVVLCAAMAVSMLVGCGNGGESGKQSADADKSSSKNVTLDFWTIDLKATFGDFLMI